MAGTRSSSSEYPAPAIPADSGLVCSPPGTPALSQSPTMFCANRQNRPRTVPSMDGRCLRCYSSDGAERLETRDPARLPLDRLTRLNQQVQVSEHLREGQVGLRDSDVAPHLQRDLIGAQSLAVEDLQHAGSAPAMHAQPLVDQLDVLEDRIAVTGQDETRRQLARGPERIDVLKERPRPRFRGARQRTGHQRVGRDPPEQMVARDQDLPLLVPQDGVRRAVPGPVEDAERPVAPGELLTVTQSDGHVPARAERAERGGQRAEHRGQIAGHPVAAHDRLRELVVGRGAARKALQVGGEQVKRGHLRPRTPGQDLEQAEVIHVLVGQHDQLEVLDPAAMCREGTLQVVERLAGVRPGVDQRERLVLDQIAIDSTHEERGGEGNPVDAGPFGQRQRIVGARGAPIRRRHERITASTSSRRRSMSSRERSDSRHRRSSGSVLDGRTLKCQSSYSTESPSRRYWCPSEYLEASSSILASPSDTSELISPEMKYLDRYCSSSSDIRRPRLESSSRMSSAGTLPESAQKKSWK